MKKSLFLLFVLFFVSAFSQINVQILDENGSPVSDVNISYNNQKYTTNLKGLVKIPVAETEQNLTAEKENWITFYKKINPKLRYQNLNIKMVSSEKTKEIKEITFVGRGKPKVTDLTSLEISTKELKNLTSLGGGPELL